MAAAEYNITIDIGATFGFTLTIKDSAGAIVNLSSYTAADFQAEVRRWLPRGQTQIAATFLTSFVTDGSDGKVAFELTNTATGLLNFNLAYYYDIFWVKAADDVDRLIFGKVTARRKTTQYS